LGGRKRSVPRCNRLLRILEAVDVSYPDFENLFAVFLAEMLRLFLRITAIVTSRRVLPLA